MSKLIEENKGLITERAYNNVKKSIKKLKETTSECSIENEIEIIAEYIIVIGKEITPLYVDIYEKYKDFKSANIFIDIDYDIEDIIVDEKKKYLMR